MNAIRFLFLLSFVPLVGNAQKGSIKGKVFFHYNETVKNRDVGANVVLISKSDKSYRQHTTVDLQGNYSFQEIDPGEYMLIVTSKNTKEDPVTSLESLMMYTDFLNGWSDGLSSVFQTQRYDSLQKSIEAYKYERDAKRLSEKKLQGMSQAINNQVSQFYQQLPSPTMDRLNIKSPSDKIKFEVIKVPNREISVVTEFGILSR
ncbi:MAG: carboxypeptidase-like regulatory domain-containing protein [Ginsengibacter sp.]